MPSTLTRVLVTLLCVLVVAGPAHAQGATAGGAADLAKIKKAALAIPAGSPVRLQLNDKSKVTGRIGPIDNDGFELQSVENGSIVSRKIAFDQVSKLSAGAPVSKLKALGAPLFKVLTLLGTVGALTAAFKK